MTRLIDRAGRVGFVAVAAGWIVVLGLVLRHRIFISHDTLINYAHVWFVAERLWHGHGVPIRMPMLGHGQAFTFPYGVVPWLSAGIVRPLFGDWTVTLWLVVGTVGLMVATFAALPELGRSWWAAAALIEPALLAAPLIGQVPFIWGSALMLGAIACWRRDRIAAAIVFAALAQVTHPAVVAPLLALVVAVALIWTPDRRRLLKAYAISVVPALPAAWIVFRSPVFEESSLGVKIAAFFGTLGPRALIIFVPVVLAVMARRRLPALAGPVVCAALVAVNALMWASLGLPYASRGVWRDPNVDMVAFIASDQFQRGATYRLLRVADGKIGMYQMIRAGARLDSEFFPESINRRSWPTEQQYSAFLRKRKVDYVMVWRGYIGKYRTNEQRLLNSLSAASASSCDGPVVCVRALPPGPGRNYQVYAVTRRGNA